MAARPTPVARPVLGLLVLALVLPFVVGALLGPALARDELRDVGGLFDSAKKAYAEKRYGRCLSELREIVADVGRRRIAQIQATLPAAPAGWTAEAPSEDDSGALAMFSIGLGIQRRYTKGDVSVKLEMVADSPFVAPIAAILSNPAFLPPQAKIVTVKGRKALLESDEEAKRTSLRLLLQGDTTLLSLEGDGATKADVSETFANALDLDALEKALSE